MTEAQKIGGESQKQQAEFYKAVAAAGKGGHQDQAEGQAGQGIPPEMLGFDQKIQGCDGENSEDSQSAAQGQATVQEAVGCEGGQQRQE